MTLSDRAVRRAWWICLTLVAALTATGVVLEGLAVNSGAGTSWGSGGPVAAMGFVLMTLMFPVSGFFITRRQPRNRIGWVLVAIGLVWALDHFCGGFASFFWIGHGRLVAASHAFVAIDQPLWIPALGLTGVFVLLLFPDGNVPSPRWHVVTRAAAVAITAGVILMIILPGPESGTGFPEFENPFGIGFLKPITPLVWLPVALLPILILVSAVGVVVRFRRSRGVERQQMKWLAAAGLVVALLFVIAMLPLPLTELRQDASLLSFGLIPAAVAFAVLKYRLYDIDVVINRALVYGALAAFITLVYVAIVVGIGAALGQGDNPNVGLSILATAVVALSFGAVRERVQHVANRLVYGKRATPYEALSELASRMAGSFATEDLLPRMASVLASATGAERAEVWLRLGPRLVREAVWPAPADDHHISIEAPDASELPSLPGAATAFPVSHDGELLGALAVAKARGDALNPADERVALDLASQAGLVLRNVRLVEDLRASRQRIVAAQDSERRRLERDIHDGAQQDLVTLSLATNMALAKLDGAHPKASEMLAQANDELRSTLTELRELARGIHPAVLTEQGLPAALESLAERSIVSVTVRADVPGRLDPTVEATAYYVVSEALQNVQKYAKATSATVRAARADGHLNVEVSDDGIGGADVSRGSGLRGLLDRISAVDGSLHLDSPPGRGTRLRVDLPC